MAPGAGDAYGGMRSGPSGGAEAAERPALDSFADPALDAEIAACPLCDERRRASFDAPFALAFQPIVDLDRRAVFAQEALIRGPEGGGAETLLDQVRPHTVAAFDHAVRDAAVAAAAALGFAGAVSINVHPNALHDPHHCLRGMLDTARRAGWPADRIILELTEHERVRDAALLRRLIEVCRGLGIRVAIDDFGAGYAGLSLLAELRPDILKLDHSLTRGAPADPARQVLLRGVLDIARGLGIEVVAEGVETWAERDWLHAVGVPLQQGRQFAGPRLRGAARTEELRAAGVFVSA